MATLVGYFPTIGLKMLCNIIRGKGFNALSLDQKERDDE
ncbi:hypothetical protein Cflav_PD0668 [Pedosphaera parvula Ellin514]|uniref:Uncharacterized protein n=1 Tax=Pedosphaera parvula (strain Ellin514) TaxID=320771 RepID=B9XRE3_PEDPL|nr:hypothetical protein Cflav_PD0668 [Pedosphaera parvula Ellin514]